MRRETAAAFLALILGHPGSASGQWGRPEAGSHVSWSADACMTCHATAEAEELAARITRPCRDMCATCHAFREGHHPVGVRLSRPVPAPLLLTKRDTNTCVTCHDVTRPRFESSAWVSQSLFDRAIHRSNRNPTYYLVMRNDRGQLCRNCH